MTFDAETTTDPGPDWEAIQDEWDEHEGGERYCWACGGRGWIVRCPDDLCHGQDECIHGDPPSPCWECNRNGEQEDRLYG